MKETASISIFFLLVGIYSGAMNIAATFIFIIIAGLLTYVAWLGDRKDRRIKQKISVRRKERLARRKLT